MLVDLFVRLPLFNNGFALMQASRPKQKGIRGLCLQKKGKSSGREKSRQPSACELLGSVNAPYSSLHV